MPISSTSRTNDLPTYLSINLSFYPSTQNSLNVKAHISHKYVYMSIYILISSSSRTIDLPTNLSINQSIFTIHPPKTSLNVKAHTSHKYKIASKIMIPHVLIFNFFVIGLGKRNTVPGMVADVSSVQCALNIFMIAILIIMLSNICTWPEVARILYIFLCFEIFLENQ